MMDCERFDHVVIDALYGELDELTLAATRRHAESCTRCQAVWAGLKATRKIGVLPLAPVPASLSERAFAYARDAQQNVSWTTRFGRVMSRAAAYAMRPQTAMAAIFMLAVGGAVLFLRPRPERIAAQSHVSVTEHGVPELTGDQARLGPAAMPIGSAPVAMRRDEVMAKPSPPAAAVPDPAPADPRFASAGKAKLDDEPAGDPAARGRVQAVAAAERRATGGASAPEERRGSSELAMAPAAAARAADPSIPAEAQGDVSGSASAAAEYARAKDLYQSQRYTEAERAFLAVARQGGKDAAWAQYYAAKSAEAEGGCRDAAPKYEAVDARYPATGAGAEGLFSAAGCYRTLGDTARARQIYGSLRGTAAYRERADNELANTTSASQAQAARPSAKPAAAPVRKATKSAD